MKKSLDFVSMSQSEENSVHGDMRATWEDHGDSSTVRTESLDAVLATILQEIENKRADNLQRMVAEMLQAQFDQENQVAELVENG